MSFPEGPAVTILLHATRTSVTLAPIYLVLLIGGKRCWLQIAQAPVLSSETSSTKIGGPLLHLVVRDCLLVLPSSKARQLLRAR